MTSTQWRKALRSHPSDNCVELAHTMWAMRDSKNPGGVVLTGDMAALVAAVKTGRFDRRAPDQVSWCGG